MITCIHCNKSPHRRMMCSGHYQKWRIGEIEDSDGSFRDVKPCMYCSDAVFSKGMCRLHYTRSVNGVPMEMPKKRGRWTRCKYCGDEEWTSLDVCRFHAKRIRNGTAVDAPRNRKRNYDVPEGMAHCVECDEILPLSNFPKSSSNKLGVKGECKLCIRYTIQRRMYGIDEREILVDQGYACGICGDAHLDRWAIDHDHATGKVRGVLCNNCNWGLGLFRDDPRVIERAIEYLG